MLIVDLAKWEKEKNEYYVVVEYKEDSYYYSFTCDINNKITHYSILPMDFDEETDEPIFTDEYLGIADYLLYDVGEELENILHFDILKE